MGDCPDDASSLKGGASEAIRLRESTTSFSRGGAESAENNDVSMGLLHAILFYFSLCCTNFLNSGLSDPLASACLNAARASSRRCKASSEIP